MNYSHASVCGACDVAGQFEILAFDMAGSLFLCSMQERPVLSESLHHFIPSTTRTRYHI